MTELNLHFKLVQMVKKLDALGLNHGTAGNVSVRSGDGFLITPSGISAEGITEADLVWVGMDGQSLGRWQPSSEWLFHRDILMNRPEFNAVIHTHSVAASTLACMRRDIPPFHYMVALLGGDTIRCADYATFGTQVLSDNALKAMENRKACLLANHGMIAAGNDLSDALKMTIEVENLSELYVRTLQLGEPVLLTAEEFAEAQAKFTHYGKRQTAA